MSNSKDLIILITGTNRGLGNAICQRIAETPNTVVYASSRSGFKLDNDPKCQVHYPLLDTTDSSSIDALFNAIEKDHNRLDILINNAGVNLNLNEGITPDNARKTLEVNYRGTLSMCQKFLPLLHNSVVGGRIVNVSSTGSLLDKYTKDIQDSFRNAKTIEDVNRNAEKFIKSIERGTNKQDGYADSWPYSFSKACMNAITMILARENPKVLINACCPGWVGTDLGGGNATKEPEEGADIPLRLAFDDINGVSGKYWANDSVHSKDDGKVQDW